MQKIKNLVFILIVFFKSTFLIHSALKSNKYELESQPIYHMSDIRYYKNDCSFEYSHRQGPCVDDCMCQTSKGLRCDSYVSLCLCLNKKYQWSSIEQKCVYSNDYERKFRMPFNCNNDPSLYFDYKDRICLRKSSHYGYCLSNEMCLNSLVCFYQKCVCKENNYIWSSDVAKCVGTYGAPCDISLGQECATHDQGLICSLNIRTCTCPFPNEWNTQTQNCDLCTNGYVKNDATKICAGLNGESCNSKLVCVSEIDNFECVNNICQCVFPWSWDWSTNKCICSNTFYHLSSDNKCVGLGSAPCSMTTSPPVECDTSPGKYLKCDEELGICNCPSNYIVNDVTHLCTGLSSAQCSPQTQCSPDVSNLVCAANNICTCIAPYTQSSTLTCECVWPYFYSTTSSQCVGLDSAACSVSIFCYDTPNFECNEVTCQCVPPYTWQSSSKSCVCLDPYNLDETGNFCVGKIGSLCNLIQSIQCDSRIPHLTCSSSIGPGSCIIYSTYLETCITNYVCTESSMLECVNNVCMCNEALGLYWNSNSLTCVNFLKNYWPISNSKMNDVTNGIDMLNFGTLFTADRFGNLNAALSLNNGYTQVQNGVYFSETELTISVWVYPKSLSSFCRVIDFSISGPSTNNVVLAFQQTNNHQPYIDFDIPPENFALSSVPLIDEQWQFLTATFDGSVLKIYINGILTGSAPNNFNLPLVNRFSNYVGKSNYGGDGLSDSYLDDLRFYSKCLSQSEIINLMNSLVSTNGGTCGNGLHCYTTPNFACVSGTCQCLVPFNWSPITNTCV